MRRFTVQRTDRAHVTVPEDAWNDDISTSSFERAYQRYRRLNDDAHPQAGIAWAFHVRIWDNRTQQEAEWTEVLDYEQYRYDFSRIPQSHFAAMTEAELKSGGGGPQFGYVILAETAEVARYARERSDDGV